VWLLVVASIVSCAACVLLAWVQWPFLALDGLLGTRGTYTRRTAVGAGWKSIIRCCAAEVPTEQPRTVCGIHWLYLPVGAVVMLGPILAAVLDLSAGYPGAGLSVIAIQWPSIAIAFSFIGSSDIVSMYIFQGLLYLIWSAAFAAGRGIGGWGTAEGGNIVGIAMTLI